MCEGDETAREVGILRAKRPEGGFSYRNAEVVRSGGEILGALIGYSIETATSDDNIAQAPMVMRPLLELENEAEGSSYVSALAVMPEARNAGIGLRLLESGEARAKSAGADRLSLIVRNRNPACRLYRRFGFRDVARRPICTQGWDFDGRDWLLLINTISPEAV